MHYKPLSRKQLLALSWWNRPATREHDGIICDGAVRSGKTVCLADGFMLWSMARFDGQTFGICGKTIASLRRNLTGCLPQWLGGILAFREHVSSNKLTVTAPNGHRNTYYLFGGQDESSCQLIQGITLAGVLLDEVALMPRSFVEQAVARCSVPGSKIWFSCNPEGPEHWFYRQWVLKAQEKKLLHLHFTMDDNPGLDPQVRQRYKRLYDGVFYERYVLGLWTASQGLIYAFDPQKHVARRLPKDGRWYISVDYGTMNPFSAGLWCVSGGTAYRVREYYYSGRETGRMRTDEQYHKALVELAGDKPVELVVVDPSAASFIATVRHHGIFRVRKAKNDVMSGIRTVSRLLQEGRLRIGADCKAALREFSLYSWEEQAERPCKCDDHAMDDIRYFCTTVLERRERP